MVAVGCGFSGEGYCGILRDCWRSPVIAVVDAGADADDDGDWKRQVPSWWCCRLVEISLLVGGELSDCTARRMGSLWLAKGGKRLLRRNRSRGNHATLFELVVATRCLSSRDLPLTYYKSRWPWTANIMMKGSKKRKRGRGQGLHYIVRCALSKRGIEGCVGSSLSGPVWGSGRLRQGKAREDKGRGPGKRGVF